MRGVGTQSGYRWKCGVRGESGYGECGVPGGERKFFVGKRGFPGGRGVSVNLGGRGEGGFFKVNAGSRGEGF
ncbi:unnamed protein product [Staurois parvus]|uniref:Uncharacterized protein n=1 Tax=Staurois parvus TaxID=386267 RepID=A0ABN9A9Y6_9NEOB|nr:unnamed protein product [Staurois parvus]